VIIMVRRATALALTVLAVIALAACGSQPQEAGDDPHGPTAPGEAPTVAELIAQNAVTPGAIDSMAESFVPVGDDIRQRLAAAAQQLTPTEAPPSPVGSVFPGYYLMIDLVDVYSPDLTGRPCGYYSNAQALWDIMTDVLPVSTEESGAVGPLLTASRLEVEGRSDWEIERTFEDPGRIAAIVRVIRGGQIVDQPGDPGDVVMTLTFTVDSESTIVNVYEDYAEVGGVYYHAEDMALTLGTSINAG